MGAGAITEAFSALAPFRDGIVTKHGSLLCAFRLDGIAPEAVSDLSAKSYSALYEIALSVFPDNYIVNQYFVHTEGHTVSLDACDIPVIGQLVADRETALNERGLAKTQLIFTVEAPDPDNLNSSLTRAAVHALRNLGNGEVMTAFIKRLKATDATVLRVRELEQRYRTLENRIKQFLQRVSMFMDGEQLQLDQLFGFKKFLATGNPAYLIAGSVACPEDYVDAGLPDGDIDEVTVQYRPVLKLNGAAPVFCQIANVHALPKNLDTLWISGMPTALSVRGNYVILLSTRMLTETSKTFKLAAKDLEFRRSTVKLSGLLKGDTEGEMTPAVKEKLDLIKDLEDVEDRATEFYVQIAAFNQDPKVLFETTQALESCLSTRRVQLAWDGIGLPISYKTLQPGGHHFSYRKQFSYLGVIAELSLKYCYQSGTPRFELNNHDFEALYIFESRAGTPIYLNPAIGGRMMMLCIGPTRSGKTFTRKTLHTHMLKYGTHITSVDIDDGMESLAALMQDDGGYFTGAQDGSAALNPFALVDQVGVNAFIPHFLTLARLMLESNDAEDAQKINTPEQQMIDSTIRDLMQISDPSKRTLEHFLGLLPEQELEAKFARWKNDGAFNNIFDASEDSMGGISKRFTAFNLQTFRDTPAILRPFLMELFFRVTHKFENVLPSNVMKMLDIDEAHKAFSIPAFVDFLNSKFITWAKYLAGISMWTQSPKHLSDLEQWGAIRGAITTYIFCADPTADYESYQTTFQISRAHVDTIRGLTPKKEILIYQPEERVCSVAQLNVEPAQYVANTSAPFERKIRSDLMREYGAVEGFERAIDEIVHKKKRTAA